MEYSITIAEGEGVVKGGMLSFTTICRSILQVYDNVEKETDRLYKKKKSPGRMKVLDWIWTQ